MDRRSDSNSGPVRRLPAKEGEIARYFGNLLGCEVRVSPVAVVDFAANGGIVAAYIDHLENLEALFICDVTAAAHLASATSIINAAQVEAALEKQSIDGVLRERLFALCGLIGNLFVESANSAGGSRLLLRGLTDVSDALQDVASLMITPGARADFALEIANNDCGQFALLTR